MDALTELKELSKAQIELLKGKLLRSSQVRSGIAAEMSIR